MHNAPPVIVPVGRFVWGGRIVLGLALLSALMGGLTGWVYPMTFARAAIMGGVWALAAGFSWWMWRRELLPPGQLAWDGQAWSFHAGNGLDEAVSVELRWDAGPAMLLSLGFGQTTLRSVRHTWLQATHMPQQWHALRCAVYSGHTL